MSLKEKQSGLPKIAIPSLNFIQDSDSRQKVIEILTHALADESVLSMKTRNAKWNLCGTGFFELCTIYELHRKQINDFADEIYKRTRMLHGPQIGSFSEYLAKSRLAETPGVIPDVFMLLSDHESVIRFFREDYRNCAKFYGDFYTSDVLIKIIRQHEKIAWMLRSFIQKEYINNVSTETCLETY